MFPGVISTQGPTSFSTCSIWRATRTTSGHTKCIINSVQHSSKKETNFETSEYKRKCTSSFSFIIAYFAPIHGYHLGFKLWDHVLSARVDQDEWGTCSHCNRCKWTKGGNGNSKKTTWIYGIRHPQRIRRGTFIRFRTISTFKVRVKYLIMGFTKYLLNIWHFGRKNRN